MPELAGKAAAIKISGTAASLAEEALEHVTDNTWQIETATKQVIDRDSTPVLELSDGIGGWDDIAYTSVNKLTGVFTFSGDGYEDTEEIRVKTGNYLPMSTATYAHEFSYSRGVELPEVTPFGATHKNRLAGLKFASGTLSQWDATSEYYTDALVAGDPVVIEFLYETGADPVRVWALLESVEMAAAIADPQNQVVSFISTDELLDN